MVSKRIFELAARDHATFTPSVCPLSWMAAFAAMTKGLDFAEQSSAKSRENIHMLLRWEEGDEVGRIISARKATPRERRAYEEERE